MPCYGCGESFGFFNKEHGCKNCGFAFCSKCLTKRTKVPKLNDEKHSVCNKCYNILTGKIKPKDNKESYSPPEAYKKRVAALEERESKGEIHKSGQHAKSHGHQKYSNLSPSEREIAERLEKLKEKPPEQVAAAKVSEKDIASRLANLKGENPEIKAGQSKPFYKPPDRRTQQAQIDDLLDEIAGEIEIESRLPDPTKQIEERLSRLKGDNSQNPDQRSSGTENNLNRSDSSEAKPFTHTNIGQDKSKQNNQEGGEISIEEMNKLIEQTADELEMDAKKAMQDLEKDKDIMRRLQEIKSRKKDDVNKQEGTPRPEGEQAQSDSDNENEEEMTKNLVKQILEENKLDEAAARDGVDVGALSKNQKKSNAAEEEEDIDDDELPYCTLCTEDATVRCHGCDLDLYCARCWKQSHVDFQMEDHETSKYIIPKGKS